MKKIMIFVLTIIVLILTGCDDKLDITKSSPINTLPMYGEEEKNELQIQADQKLIEESIKISGSREVAAEHAIQRGWEYYYAGDLDTSMNRFNQAWLLDPQNPDVYWGFGLIVGAKGQVNEAIRIFSMGLQLNQSHTMLLCNVGYSYINKALSEPQKRATYLNESITYFERANSIDTEVEYCHSSWAIALYYQGKYAEAWQHINKAKGLGGQSLDPRFVKDLSSKMANPQS